MEAAAGYLRGLREGRRLSRARVAAAVRVSEMSIWRIEEERQQPRAELLASFVSVIQGDIHDVYTLLLDRNATFQDGQRRAEELLRREGQIALRDTSPLSSPRSRPAENGSAPQQPEDDLLIEIEEELRRGPAIKRLLRGVIDAWREAQS